MTQSLVPPGVPSSFALLLIAESTNSGPGIGATVSFVGENGSGKTPAWDARRATLPGCHQNLTRVVVLL
jgi:hypothetical protein